MTLNPDSFNADHVDEQVDQLSPQIIPFDRSDSRINSQAGAHLIRNLHGYYQPERNSDLASLERVWERVSAHLSDQSRAIDEPPTPHFPLPEERIVHRMSDRLEKHTASEFTPIASKLPSTSGRSWRRGLTLCAAAIITALLVTSLVTVLHLSRVSTGGSPASQAHSTAALTPTATPPLPIGTTVYTTPSTSSGFGKFAWSFDNTRIATFSSIGDVEIWDATTGQHLVKASLASGEWAWSIAWSSNRQVLAVATNQEILLVDGQTGNTLHAYQPAKTTAYNSAPSGSHQGPLFTLLPASGGFGYRDLAWSPDGKHIVASLSGGASGSVVVLDVETGSTGFTLPLEDSTVAGSVAWSSDGKYIAAQAYSTQDGLSNQVKVWDTASHQLVFNHPAFVDSSDTPISWQPHSDNLTWVGRESSGNDAQTGLQVWDVVKGIKIKQYQSVYGSVGWSPDGQAFAYAGVIVEAGKNISAVIIIDAVNGRQVFAYKASPDNANIIEGNMPVPAWSPDGTYIVSAEAQPMATPSMLSQSSSVAHVWIA